jgi:hypothetical protein
LSIFTRRISFSFTLDGYGTAKAVYCKDPFGTTLELMQMVKE